jgi:hypothetical protein
MKNRIWVLALVGSGALVAQGSEETMVTREQSIGPGQSVVYQFDGPVRIANGFEVRGGSVEFRFGGGLTKPSSLNEKTKPSTTLTDATLQKGLLNLNYSLADAASVSVEVFGISGRSLGKWTWREEAGRHVRELQLKKSARGGLLFMRWSSGTHRVVRKVTVLK